MLLLVDTLVYWVVGRLLVVDTLAQMQGTAAVEDRQPVLGGKAGSCYLQILPHHKTAVALKGLPSIDVLQKEQNVNLRCIQTRPIIRSLWLTDSQ